MRALWYAPALPARGKRTFFLLAACLFVLAIGANMEAKSRYAHITVGIATTPGYYGTPTHNRALWIGEALEVISYGLALAGLCCWIASGARNERCRHSVLVVLAVTFVGLLLVMV